MRTALLLSCLAVCAVSALAQTQPAATNPPASPSSTQPAAGQPATSGQSAQPRATTAPAKPATQNTAPAAAAGRGAPPASSRGGIALTVTDMRGTTIDGVHAELIGLPTLRSGETEGGGLINFPGLPAGTYRLRFTGPTVTTFEREVTIVPPKILALDINLNPAPPPKETIKVVEVLAPAPPAPAPVVAPAPGPVGQPQVVSLVDLAMKELDRRQPRLESLVACSGEARSTLLQINEDQPPRLYENAESFFYVVAGEGVLRVNDKESKLVAGTFASVPRQTSFVLARRGRNPLVLHAILSGEPCAEAK
jgi:hypothetical protein